MRKLSDRDIIKLHKLSRAGASNSRISSELSIHRNTVYRHLMLRFQYSPEVANALCLNASLPTGKVLRLYEASAYLPGWPSDGLVFKLYREGVLKAKKRLVSPNQSVLTVTLADIRRAAAKMLPAGLWVRTDTLGGYCDMAEAVIAECSGYAVHSRFWRSTNFCYLPAPRVFSAASELDTSINVPLPVRHRAAICLDKVGVATI